MLYFCRLETIGQATEPDNVSGCQLSDGAGYLVSVGYGGGFGVSQIPETQQGFSIAVQTIVEASPTVQVKPGWIVTLAPLIASDRFQKRFKFVHIKR